MRVLSWFALLKVTSREVIKNEERVVTPFLLPCPRSVTTMLIRRIGRVKERRPPTSRFHTPCDTTSRKIVRREHNFHLISRHDTHKIHANATRENSQHLVMFVQLDLKHGIWEGFNDFTLYFNFILLWHSILSRTTGVLIDDSEIKRCSSWSLLQPTVNYNTHMQFCRE